VALHLNQLERDMTMNKILLSFFCYIAVTCPAFAALQAGDAAPNFQVRASLAGEEFDYSLENALSQGPVVVYFYPSAFTRGCNIQAHEFAVNMEEFAAAGASVIGVSLDSIERLNDFSADPEYCAGELAVASDFTGTITQSYDLSVRQHREDMTDTRGVTVDHNLAERVTFIVLPNGTIAKTIGGISPLENVQQSLEAVQQL
jgi:peroxiredoxin Q/BCP